MDLLFNTIGTQGNSELKELLGFIDADLKFKNIIPDIITATNSIKKIIGNEVYNFALAKYIEQSNDFKSLIYAIRYPISIDAYRLYAPNNDISHTNNGRKMRQDDGEKLPFEWMIDRDNTALEKRYYRAVDDLIIFLDDADGEVKEKWRSSKEFKKSNKLFIRTVDEFDEFFPINSRLLLLKLGPGINECENFEIVPRIGIEKFKFLKTKQNESIDFTNVELELVRLIKQACVSHALAWAMPRLSVNLFPDGVLQHVTSDRATTRGEVPAVKSEVEAARQAFQRDAEKYFKLIENFVAPAPIIPANGSVLPDHIFGTNFISG